jgi:hypothetical protein
MMNRTLWFTLAALVAVVAAMMYFVAMPVLQIGCGYTAKIVCSAVFITNRPVDDIRSTELAVSPLTHLLHIDVDRALQQVRVSTVFDRVLRISALAQYHGGHIGCSLVSASSRFPLSFNRTWSIDGRDEDEAWAGEDSDWLAGEELIPDRSTLDLQGIAQTVSKQFTDTSGTRAVVVVHNGKVVAEQYASGYDKHSPLLGWSMTKSLLNALVGMRILDRELALNDTVHHKHWNCEPTLVRSQSAERRRAIVASFNNASNALQASHPVCRVTVETLLCMNSGLPFEETYSVQSDPTLMLFTEHSTAAYAAKRALQTPHEGAKWRYSSGSSNLLSHVLKDTFTSQRDYLSYPLKLFRAINMRYEVVAHKPQAIPILLLLSVTHPLYCL